LHKKALFQSAAPHLGVDMIFAYEGLRYFPFGKQRALALHILLVGKSGGLETASLGQFIELAG